MLLLEYDYKINICKSFFDEVIINIYKINVLNLIDYLYEISIFKKLNHFSIIGAYEIYFEKSELYSQHFMMTV